MGGPLPRQTYLVAGQKCEQTRPGGVFCIAPLPTVIKTKQHYKNREEEILFDSTRWTTVSLPIGKGKRAIFVDNYYAAQSVDRETGIDNSRAMRRVFVVASSRGPAPGLICMDANLQVKSEGALRGLMNEYG